MRLVTLLSTKKFHSKSKLNLRLEKTKNEQ
jgi:hypothetical protein